ncbi:hypothetical protein [Bacillus sp. FJAT-45350]|uniref:hypothetical protein n=1 Tax=Bacillus sp. FJAT-45350 TaxID=2011014 RepID=UPI000BB85C2A|nr:hypothetical protein [Bacillus sp. FJAT-45350]
MYEKQLEFRGIHREDIVQYLLLLGGNQKNNVLGDFVGEQWEAVVSEESFMRLFHSDIPVVFVTFTSENEELCKEVIRKLRLKTFRAGG